MKNKRQSFSLIFSKSRTFSRRLKRLNLGGNELTRIPTQALSSLELLKKLELQENRISTIKAGDFEGKINNPFYFTRRVFSNVPVFANPFFAEQL